MFLVILIICNSQYLIEAALVCAYPEKHAFLNPVSGKIQGLGVIQVNNNASKSLCDTNLGVFMRNVIKKKPNIYSRARGKTILAVCVNYFLFNLNMP